jgi:hypothetical protein
VAGVWDNKKIIKKYGITYYSVPPSPWGEGSRVRG